MSKKIPPIDSPVFTIKLQKGLAERQRLPLADVISVLEEVRQMIADVGREIQRDLGIEKPTGDFGLELLAGAQGIVLEAQLIDQTKAKDREDNKRRKWDCFHIATAMVLGCRTLYALDEKMLRRKEDCGITRINFSKPVPTSLPLLPEGTASFPVT